MGYKGRVFSIGIVVLFNILRYIYYHQYLGYPFEASFFVLTFLILLVAVTAGWQYDIAKYYSERDPLTNTYNRRTVYKVFEKQMSSYAKHGDKIGVVLIDLDDFKHVNDTYGHQTGDELLLYTADSIKKNAKKDDLIIRWGGDEFVHIIPNVAEHFQKEYMHKLPEQLAHIKSDSLSSVSVSIGIAVYPDDGDDFETLVHKADQTMYKMKNG